MRTFLTQSARMPRVKSFSPSLGLQENALFGADVHNFRCGRPRPEGFSKKIVQKKFALTFLAPKVCENHTYRDSPGIIRPRSTSANPECLQYRLSPEIFSKRNGHKGTADWERAIEEQETAQTFRKLRKQTWLIFLPRAFRSEMILDIVVAKFHEFSNSNKNMSSLLRFWPKILEVVDD